MPLDVGRARARAARLPHPSGWTVAVVGVLLVTFLLRIWGVRHGMPYAFNADESAHFVPKAIALFGHSWNPHYFVNPPAYTYLLHLVFSVWFGGRDGVYEAYATDPESVFVVARVTAGLVGTLAVWLLYVCGARLFDRRVGLLAAALFGVAFLPVFYSHLALNDVPTLAPICLAMVGAAGILRRGRVVDYLVAGAGLGFAAAFKYTGGIVLLPILGAAAAQCLTQGGRKPAAARGLALAGLAALVAFLVANPYALLSFNELKDGLEHQTTVADDAIGKLGLTQDNGVMYYLWTLTWGLGIIPAVAALGAIVPLWRDERRLVWILVPAPIFFLLFMGSQTRFFGRWLIPVFPMICLLASYAMLELADGLGRRRPALRPTFVALAAVLLVGQGVIACLHNGIVLSRKDTRISTREWMVANIPAGSKIVVEPVVPDAWASDVGTPNPETSNGNRWVKFSTSRLNQKPDGTVEAGAGPILNVEDYEKSLTPELIDIYERQRFCWVISGSTQRGRAEVEPDVVPKALAYYAELERRADVLHTSSPYSDGKGPVTFNFDWSFDYYPRAYARPGPLMVVYRLRGGACKS